MDDPLIARLEADLVARGFATLRFNFRGVGASEGQPSDGRLEPLDIAGAVACMLKQPETDGRTLALVGHAFGAGMAIAYAGHDPRVGTVVAVSPPIVRLPAELRTLDRPVLFVTGEYDEVCPEFKLAPLVGALPRLQGIRIVRGARHMLHGKEGAAAAIVVSYLATWADAPEGT
jgi:alpha/beta superfamily hydrolase